jgi:hypothetical protein
VLPQALLPYGKSVARGRFRNSGKTRPTARTVNVPHRAFYTGFAFRPEKGCTKANRRFLCPRTNIAAGSGSMGMPTRCPQCQGANISKSKRRGLLESLVFTLIHVRPYRCQSCDFRFFRWAVPHAQRVAHLASTTARSDFQGTTIPLSGRENAVDRSPMEPRTARSGPAIERP